MSGLLNCQIADALEKCDWAGASIGNKAIVSLAIEALRNVPLAPTLPDTGFIEAAMWHEAEAKRKQSVAVKSKRLGAQIATHEASAAHFRSVAPVSPDATGKCGELVTVGYVHRGTIGLLMEGVVSKAVIVPNAGGDFKTPVMLFEQGNRQLTAIFNTLLI